MKQVFVRFKKPKHGLMNKNRMSKEKTLGHDRSCKETKDTKHPDPRINMEPSTKSLKRGTMIASEKRYPTTNMCLTGICQAHC